jgi:flagellar basal-body rod protein FlgF
MLSQVEHQDIIANNLANCSTPGFKRTAVGFRSFELILSDTTRQAEPLPPATARCVLACTFSQRDASQGHLEDVSSPTGMAIDGPGHFVVRTSEGLELTRSGNFKLDSLGQIITSEGHAVMGQSGPINVAGGDWSVDADGNVQVNGLVVDRLQIEPEADISGIARRGRIVQGNLESSNVNTVREMVNMITAFRAYEANQKAVQALDQTLDKVINQMGRGA